MQKILTIATAGLRPDQLKDTDHALYPRVDYIELQRHIDTDILDYSAYDRSRLGKVFRYLETQLRSDLYLTALGLLRKRDYGLTFGMSERTGIPYSALNRLSFRRKPFATMFQSWSQLQEDTITRLNLFSAIDKIAVHCKSMKSVMVNLGAVEERIDVLPYGSDHQFFKLQPGSDQQPCLIMTIGEIRSRDYATLFEAIAGLPVKLVAVASGSWYAREKHTSLDVPIPDNVIISPHLSPTALRELYARSQLVVLPVYDRSYSAGSTASMEAGCMERAVIATSSKGIVDFVIDGETGILVEPGSVAAMQSAIQDLLARPEKARRLGKNARERIEEERNLDIYVEHMAQFLRSV